MIVVDSVYTDIEEKKKFSKKLKSISKKKPVQGLFVVTYPLFGYGLLEVYDYNELLQKIYKDMKEIIVVGVSTTKSGAKQLACDIVSDTYFKQNNFDIKSFMGGE